MFLRTVFLSTAFLCTAFLRMVFLGMAFLGMAVLLTPWHRHLKDLILDEKRCAKLTTEYNNLFLDYSRQRVLPETMQLLYKLAERAQMRDKIQAMFNGEHINATEDRAVLHVALRAPRTEVIKEGGRNVVEDVWEVLDRIRDFTNKVRNGEWRGVTGRPLTNVVAIGIGGSFLGPLFVHTALRYVMV